MRTTINLPDHLLVEAKKLAAESNTSLTRVLEDRLRLYLAEERALIRRSRRPPPLPILSHVKPVAGVDLDDTSALLELE